MRRRARDVRHAAHGQSTQVIAGRLVGVRKAPGTSGRWRRAGKSAVRHSGGCRRRSPTPRRRSAGPGRRRRLSALSGYARRAWGRRSCRRSAAPIPSRATLPARARAPRTAGKARPTGPRSARQGQARDGPRRRRRWRRWRRSKAGARPQRPPGRLRTAAQLHPARSAPRRWQADTSSRSGPSGRAMPRAGRPGSCRAPDWPGPPFYRRPTDKGRPDRQRRADACAASPRYCLAFS